VIGKAIESGGLGVVGEADGVDFGDTELMDGKMKRTGVVRRQGEGDVDSVDPVSCVLESLIFRTEG